MPRVTTISQPTRSWSISTELRHQERESSPRHHINQAGCDHRSAWFHGGAPSTLGRVDSTTRRIVTRRLADVDLDAVVVLSLAAWAPVFASLEQQLGAGIFAMIYPDWRRAQAAAVRAVCLDEGNDVRVACVDDRVVGFVAVGLVAEDAAQACEIHMIAVDPEHQRSGVGSALMRQALAVAEAHGVELAVIATGGDPGHAPAARLYERFGFRPLPRVRYYRTV